MASLNIFGNPHNHTLATTTGTGLAWNSTHMPTLSVDSLRSPVTDQLQVDTLALQERVLALELELKKRLKLEELKADPLSDLREQILLFKIGA